MKVDPRSSEFWMAVFACVGQLGVNLGWWTQADYNQVLLPALTYITGRIISKAAKAVPGVKKEAA